MKKAKTVTRKLQVEPSVLDGQVDKNVGDIVRKKYVNYCSKTDGYILDVLDVKIMDCDISPTNSSVQCNVAFTAICMKPRPGDTNVGKICLIFEMGVLLELHGVMKVLVPRDDKGGFFSVRLAAQRECVTRALPDQPLTPLTLRPTGPRTTFRPTRTRCAPRRKLAPPGR